jgi:epoxyqueuosine reductase
MTKADLQASERSRILKDLASKHGFSSCMVSSAGFLEEEAPRLDNWLKNGRHGKMSYMENHFDKRLDPTKLVDGCRSVVTLVFNYFPEKEIQPEGELRISKYAYGEDYHFVLKDKLRALLEEFRTEIGDVGGRVFVDSAPILEKAWAAKNGTGWLGKNGNIIHPKKGSFFFLCEMLIDVELEEDSPMQDHCGTCTACMDACPTDAIFRPYEVDGSRCISYLTIELKEAIPNEFSGRMDNWIFGCDICQDVCPWNKKFSIAHKEPRFLPDSRLSGFSRNEWTELTTEVFGSLFGKSAISRTGFSGLSRNILFAGTKGG